MLGGLEYGLLVPPGDSAALAKTLYELIQDESRRKVLGEHARRRARELFDISAYHRNVTRRLLEDLSRQI